MGKIKVLIRGHPNKEKMEKAVIEFIQQTKKGATRK